MIMSEDIRHSPYTVTVAAKSIPTSLMMSCCLTSSFFAPSIFSLYHILSIFFVHDHGHLTNGTTNPTSLHRILFSAPHFCLLAHFLSFFFDLSVWLSLGTKWSCCLSFLSLFFRDRVLPGLNSPLRTLSHLTINQSPPFHVYIYDCVFVSPHLFLSFFSLPFSPSVFISSIRTYSTMLLILLTTVSLILSPLPHFKIGYTLSLINHLLIFFFRFHS